MAESSEHARLRPAAREAARWAVLAAGALWLARGLLTSGLCGGGDSQCYANMMADSVDQARHGVFPIFVGQGVHEFNGAVYPIRLAPALQYLGAALDAFTFHTLNAVVLSHVLLVGLTVLSALAAYLALAAAIPCRRNLAAAFALLFLACPGVCGLLYLGDLYMTWTTVPLISVVMLAWVRAWREPTASGLAWLGGLLGLLLWAHSPVAMWVGLFAGLAVTARYLGRLKERRSPGPELASLAALLVVGIYPLVSVLATPLEAGAPIEKYQYALPGNIAYFVRVAFPGVLRPIAAGDAMGLSSLQLGYCLWLLLALGLAASFRRSARIAAVPAVFGALLMLLMTPVGGLTMQLWAAVPGFLRNATGNWPMDRLYLVTAAMAIWSAWLAFVPWCCRRRATRVALYAALAAMLAWSGLQANVIVAGFKRASWQAPESGAISMRPENALLTKYAYLVVPAPPSYFTHGTTDPVLENRLFDRRSLRFLVGNRETVEAGLGPAVESVGVLDMGAGVGLILPPGARYALKFRFAQPGVAGRLILSVPGYNSFFDLPEFGGTASFGSAPGHSRLLPVGNSTAADEPLHLTFQPRNGSAGAPFARIDILSYDPSRLPIDVTSWIPYRARVEAPADAWLETPRCYQDDYQAVVNGQRVPVRKSPQGLVMVPVPRGESQVKLQYYPPLRLLGAFWVSFAAALVTLGATFRLLAAGPDR